MPFYYKSHGKKPPNRFVAVARKIYNPLGFYRGYNFPLWIICGLGALAFSASRAMFLDYDGLFKEEKQPIGDWEYFSHGRGRVGMLLHLASVVPIGFLLPWQFVPVIRHKLMLFHRLNGYVLLVLLVICNTGAIMVGPGAVGGALEVRLLIGVLTISTFGAAAMAWVNIKQLQIDQHRAWMLRCWAYAFNIISLRLIQMAAMEIISRMKTFHVSVHCARIESAMAIIQPGMAVLLHEECADLGAYVSVLADANPDPTSEGLPRLDQICAAGQATFALAGVTALLLHAFAVEVYLHLTKAESDRLKRVSRERQLARHWSVPGKHAGWLTAENLGDCDESEYKAVNKVDEADAVDGDSLR